MPKDLETKLEVILANLAVGNIKTYQARTKILDLLNPYFKEREEKI